MGRPESLVPPINPSARVSRDGGKGWDGANSAWIIVSHLLTGILLYTGIGWVISLWVPHRPLLMAAGAVIGMFLAIYLIHRRLESTPSEPPTAGKGAAVIDSGTTPGRPHGAEASHGR